MMKKIAGSLKLDLAQYRELAAFTQFGSDLDEATQKQLNRGEKMVELLKQGQYVPMLVSEQVIEIWTATQGHMDDVPTESIQKFASGLVEFCNKNYPDIKHNLEKELQISDATKADLEKAIAAFKEQFKAE